jgi:tetratricopeptide (TPR) repeat protein
LELGDILKEYEEAIKMYDKSIESNPKDPSIYIKK